MNKFNQIINESLILAEDDEYVSIFDKYKQLQQQKVDADALQAQQVKAPQRFENTPENYKLLDNYLNNFIIDDSILGKFASEWQKLKSRDLDYKPQEYKYLGKRADRRVPVYKGDNVVGKAKHQFFNSFTRFFASQEYYDYLLGNIRKTDPELYNALVNFDLEIMLKVLSDKHPEIFVLDVPLSQDELNNIKKHLETFNIKFPANTSYEDAKHMVLTKFPEQYYYTQVSEKYATDTNDSNKLVLQVKMLNPKTVNIED